MRPKILVLVRHYLPGFKAGGPTQSVAALVDRLGDDIDISVLTSDRDLGDHAPFPSVPGDAWTEVGSARVYYASPKSLGVRGVARLLRREHFETLYLNSFFEPRLSITPLILRRLGLVRPALVVLAPRGEFSPGALQFSRLKKAIFMRAAKIVGLHRGVVWHATSELEQSDILASLGRGATVRLAPVLSTVHPPTEVDRPPKTAGSLRIVFVSRISPKKNLDFALKSLRTMMDARIEFDIFGPVENPTYWARCKSIMASLPASIIVRQRGELEHQDVLRTLANYHLFYLPTLGENFGHVIAESLLSGTPVLISDRTPWQGLEQARAGWDLPLAHPDGFADALRHALSWDEVEFGERSAAAAQLAATRLADPEHVAASYALLTTHIASG